MCSMLPSPAACCHGLKALFPILASTDRCADCLGVPNTSATSHFTLAGFEPSSASYFPFKMAPLAVALLLLLFRFPLVAWHNAVGLGIDIATPACRRVRGVLKNKKPSKTYSTISGDSLSSCASSPSVIRMRFLCACPGRDVVSLRFSPPPSSGSSCGSNLCDDQRA